MRVKTSKQPPPAPTTSVVGPCPTAIQIVGRPGTGSLPSTIAPPDHPLLALEVLLFVQIKRKIKTLFTTILARQSCQISLFCNDSHAISPSIETGSNSPSTYWIKPVPDSDNRRSCRKKDGRYSMFEGEILNLSDTKIDTKFLLLQF